MIPTKVFLVKGVGVHKDKLVSFELALRNAGIEKCNLVHVSSIFPPGCTLITKEEGCAMLKPGQITYCVMARNETNEPNTLISAAIGLAYPEDSNIHGYFSEYIASKEEKGISGTHAEYLAAIMLATALGIDFDSEGVWNEEKHLYEANGNIFRTTHVCQSAESSKGLWTTVIAAAVFIE